MDCPIYKTFLIAVEKITVLLIMPCSLTSIQTIYGQNGKLAIEKVGLDYNLPE